MSKQNREEILANLAEQLPQSDYDINMMFGSEDGVTKVTRGDILANPEKYLGAHIDGVVKEMMVVQGNESDQLRLQSQSAAQTKGEEYKLDQSKNAEKYFGEANSTGTGDNLGKNGRNARLAAHQLAKEYSMTPSVLSAMERVFRGLDELKDVGKIKQAVQADPEFKRATGGRTIVDDVNDVRQSTINGLAGPEITSFPDYTAEEETNFKKGIFEATDEAFNIATSYKDDPKYAIQMLELLRAEVKNSANKTTASWDHYGQLNKTVHGGLGWIAMDSEKWDDAVMQKMADELNKMVDGFDDEINHRIKDAEEQLTAQSDTTTTPISPDGTINVDAPGEGSWAFEKLKHEGGMILAEQTLGSAAEVFDLNNPIGGAFAAMGSLADSEQERARSQEVKGWYKANQDRLIEYVDQWRQQNNDNSVLKKVEHDIKTLTAAQLVEKYEDALLQLGNNRKLVPTQ